MPSGEVVDLDAATAELQAESTSSQGTFGANTPVWRLCAWGPLSTLSGPGMLGSAQYVTVWVADDPSEADGNPNVDSNGVLTLHSEARGLGGARRVVEATVNRVGGAVRIVSWREVR
jgi:hypothetical protein